VHSQPGKGTVFHLYFPALVNAEAEIVTPGKHIPKGRGERILFVDDEEALARLGQKMLTRLGYTADAETNPAAALKTVQARPDDYAVVVTDLTMPGMTGADLAKQLREVKSNLPVILITGYNGSLTLNRIQSIGIQELLLKPLTAQALGEAVERALLSPKNS